MFNVSHLATCVFAALAVPFPALFAVAASDPTAWLQLGLGGGALGVLYFLLKPLVRAQISTSKSLNETLVSMSTTGATALEVQRQLLACAQTSSEREAQTAQAITRLADKLEVHEQHDCAGNCAR